MRLLARQALPSEPFRIGGSDVARESATRTRRGPWHGLWAGRQSRWRVSGGLGSVIGHDGLWTRPSWTGDGSFGSLGCAHTIHRAHVRLLGRWFDRVEDDQRPPVARADSGAVAFIAGIWMLLAAPRIATGSGKSALSIAGMLAAVSGAWFVVGPLSWPVVTTAPHYFLPSSPPRELGFQVGYALGIGVLIIAAGVFTLGWSARHQVVATTVQRRVHGVHVAGAPPTLLRDTPASVSPYGQDVVGQPVDTAQQVTTTDLEAKADRTGVS